MIFVLLKISCCCTITYILYDVGKAFDTIESSFLVRNLVFCKNPKQKVKVVYSKVVLTWSRRNKEVDIE